MDKSSITKEQMLSEEIKWEDGSAYEEKAMTIFRKKIAQSILESSDWMIVRHQEQILSNNLKSLSDEQFNMLVKNRNNAREFIKK